MDESCSRFVLKRAIRFSRKGLDRDLAEGGPARQPSLAMERFARSARQSFREPRKRGLAKIVERGETMLPGWANVDVRAVGVAVLEQRKPVEDRRGRDAIESRKHSTFTQDTDIVECTSIAVSTTRTADSVLSIDVSFQMPFAWEGAGRERLGRPSLSGRSHGIYHLSEIRGALFDTTAVISVKSGAANAAPN
jgi:hypothetical protein